MILLPIALLIALVCIGTYYHLWYFPATIFSLLLLRKWKSKFNAKYLLIISFILLLFDTTKTHWEIIPNNFKQLLSHYYMYIFYN